MKKLCLILAYLFLFTQTASAMPLLVGQKVVYRGTITGLRISAVDGTAFIDNLPLTYSSDFSAGVDGWTVNGGTNNGNIDSIGGLDNWLRFTIDTGNGRHYLDKAITFVKGRKYNVTFTYYISSGQSNIDGVRFFENSGSKAISPILTVVDSATTVSYTFTSVGSSSIRFYAHDGDLVIFQDAGGDDVFYIKDIKISEIQPFMDGNHSIEIYDSSNRMLKGVLKAAGTGETLGENLITSWTNYVGSSFETFTSSGIDITQAIETGTAGRALSNSIGANMAGKLFRAVVPLTYASGANVRFQQFVQSDGTSATGYVQNIIAASGTLTRYATLTNSLYPYIAFRAFGALEFSTSGTEYKQVLTPSALGATIVSAKGGTTYNFSYKNDSFTYNASSYYVIIRAIR